jgi:hypothetical protein
MYGETLHSGQVTDRASPATGDYVRSDVSEEPQQQHGRSTRAANRGATNGRGLKRTVDSEDEEDATSWDGGDEDDNEPDQMDLDDDEEEDAAGDSSDAEEEDSQSLMVTLRYRKEASDPPNAPTTNGASDDAATANGAGQQSANPMGAPLAGTGAPQQPELQAAPAQPFPKEPSAALPAVPLAAPLSALPPHHAVPLNPAATHSTPSQQAYTAPVVPVAQPQAPTIGTATLPKLDGFFAPTPPYTATENAPKAHQQQTAPPPVNGHEAQLPQELRTTPLPAPTSASSWQ